MPRNSLRRESDTIVIGAGVAGLTAARNLAAKGASVVILEARDRPGGRLLTMKPKGWPTPIELGAEFIHGGNPELLTWMTKNKLGKQPVPEQHWLIRKGKRIAMPDAWDRIEGVMHQIGPKFRGSFAMWLNRHGKEMSEEDRSLAATFVEGFQGAPLARMSAPVLFKASNEEEEQFRPTGSYARFLAKLVAELPPDRVELILATAVDVVRWKRGEVIVEAGTRQWKAASVLVTVPLGVLCAEPGEPGTIRFDPPLKTKTRLLQKVESGHAMRLVLRMKSDVWRRAVIPADLRKDQGRAFGFLHSEEHFFPVWWALAPHPILVGWIGGPAAAELADASPAEIFERGRATLARLLGVNERALGKLIVDWKTHDWAGDPFTRGAYSFAVAGKETLPALLAKPVGGTVFFAGEATADPLELGTVHGAFLSGMRATKEILAHRKNAPRRVVAPRK
jgi:monoamine oxidase